MGSFKNRSRSSRSSRSSRPRRKQTQKQNHQRRKPAAHIGGAFTIGTIRVSTDPTKRLILSFDNSVIVSRYNVSVRIYIRESTANPNPRDLGNSRLPHIYLDIPISKCSAEDIVKIKFLYIKWYKSLDGKDLEKIPEFNWTDAFDARWTSIANDAATKSEIKNLNASFVAAKYTPLYEELLLKYEDPFGGFDFDAAQPSGHAASGTAFKKTGKHGSVLEKMELANAKLEQTQERLQTRRRQQEPKPAGETRMQKLWSVLRRK